MLWIPQQLGIFRRMPIGLWTVCIHIEDQPHANPAYFARQIARLRDSIISFQDVTSLYPCREESLLDRISAACLLRLKRMKAARR
jgi:hypothetical protein